MSILLLSALLATAAFASPAPNGYSFCSSVSEKLAAGSSQNAATAYCSSYLGIPVYTTKATRTKTIIVTKSAGKCTETVTAPTATKVATVTITSAVSTDTISTATTSTDVSTVTETTSTYQCQAPFAIPIGKRDVHRYKPAKPECLSKYKDSKTLTSACNCLSIRPSTTTIGTKTSTVTKTITMKNGERTATVIPTKLVTTTLTVPITAIVSTTITETTSSTTTATMTVNAVQPGDIFGVAAWKEGATFNGQYLYTSYSQIVVTDPAVFRGVGSASPFALRNGDIVDISYFYEPHFGGVDADSPYTDPQRIPLRMIERVIVPLQSYLATLKSRMITCVTCNVDLATIGRQTISVGMEAGMLDLRMILRLRDVSFSHL